MVSRIAKPYRGAWAGVFAGPGAWALSDTGELRARALDLRPQDQSRSGAGTDLRRGRAFRRVPFLASWRGALVEASEVHAGILEAPRPFLGVIGTLLGVLFALVILTHGAAGLVLNGCER